MYNFDFGPAWAWIAVFVFAAIGFLSCLFWFAYGLHYMLLHLRWVG